MKLTKAIRESVVAQIRQQTFAKEMAEFEAKTAETLDAVLLKRGEIPKADVPERFYKYVSQTTEVLICREVNCPYKDRLYSFCRTSFCSVHGNRFEVVLPEVVDEHNAIKERWNEKESALMAVLNSCTTTKQLAETLPELEPYLPKEFAAIGGALIATETVEKVKDILKGISK